MREMEKGYFDAQGSFIWDKKEEEVRDHWTYIRSIKTVKRKKAVEHSEIEDVELDPESLIDKYEKMHMNMKPQESVNKAVHRLAGTKSILSTMERLELKKEGKLQSKQDLDALNALSYKIL